ncbi:phosphonate ABC transporter, permease protein [Crocosphaera subtropica ATCC 51142]|uniref:Phosphonate ABC transporter, permease protein n=1 Tax=Crocosphaera subtropica (strain ATCC 51142 / BH68) TaxID=43989 RepID=B1WSC1_CROS5|nr:phosphonate ABC transporter, permease protein PhnE [Crocosphaera subtropica]ACB51907.1 phosphonate ABC transporter, permease protein [Crocosphaera subtropica ATCC 51142]
MTINQDKYSNLLRQYKILWYRSLINIIILLIIIIISFAVVGLLDGKRLSEGIPDLLEMVAQMLPPDFTRASDWIKPLIDTLGMSIAGTGMAVIFSLPITFGAAQNTSPHPFVYFVSRIILNIARAIPELLLGIIFVAAVGFGALPGVLALGFHSIGMVGKFFAESIEHTDNAPIEAAKAVGANHLQIIYHSILPQVLPQIADVTFYRWEYNFRASLVLGAVGAGGIGFEIIGALRLLKYQEVSALLLVVLVMVTLVDSLGNFLRKKFI